MKVLLLVLLSVVILIGGAAACGGKGGDGGDERLTGNIEPQHTGNYDQSGDEVERETYNYRLPDFDILSAHPTIGCLSNRGGADQNRPFSQFIDVFGVFVMATSEAPPAFVLHSANVLAQYLDNDGDGTPDDQGVTAHLAKEGFVVPIGTGNQLYAFGNSDCGDSVAHAASMYLDGDLWALGGIEAAGTWDTNLEEIWHIVSIGWNQTYPEYFGDDAGSQLADAMDVARGGRFVGIPDTYPDNAWYRYYDHTCDYTCQIDEYFYWILMANLDALDPSYTNKCAGSSDEWSVCTRSELARIDPLAHALLNDEGFRLPTRIPDGNYTSTAP